MQNSMNLHALISVVCFLPIIAFAYIGMNYPETSIMQTFLAIRTDIISIAIHALITVNILYFIPAAAYVIAVYYPGTSDFTKSVYELIYAYGLLAFIPTQFVITAILILATIL